MRRYSQPGTGFGYEFASQFTVASRCSVQDLSGLLAMFVAMPDIRALDVDHAYELAGRIRANETVQGICVMLILRSRRQISVQDWELVS